MYRIIFIFSVLTLVLGKKFPVPGGEGHTDWMQKAKEQLDHTLKKTKQNTNVAKNVILFVGDGMGIMTVWASRLYIGQQVYGQAGDEYRLNMDKLHYTGLSKTYCVDRQIGDSAATATALLSGVKANIYTLGVNEKVKATDCSNVEENKVSSILHQSLEKGKSAGIVTTTRVTHATPAATYAHSAFRVWESDVDFNDPLNHPNGDPTENRKYPQCKDLALQLIENNPNINVILGGGRRNFIPKETTDPEFSDKTGVRMDRRNLVKEWEQRKRQSFQSHKYVWNKSQLDDVDPEDTDYLFGLFDPSHMAYEADRNVTTDPSIADMTRKAIEILQKNDEGFFLLVEAGRIDHAHHDGKARKALMDTMALDEAIKVAKDMTSSDDTLIVVTADHSHSFVSNGYPSRGNDILGAVDNDIRFYPEYYTTLDDMPYLTLSYANGPGASVAAGRSNLTGVDTSDKNFIQQATVPLLYETHGGEDVPIYANGPMAHLFTGVVEQNYIAYAMGYASCVGPDQRHCKDRVSPTAPWPGAVNGLYSNMILTLFTSTLSVIMVMSM